MKPIISRYISHVESTIVASLSKLSSKNESKHEKQSIRF